MGTAQCGWAWRYSCLKTKSLYIKKKLTRDRIYPERIIYNRNEDEEEDMHAHVFRESREKRVMGQLKNKQHKDTEECCIHLQL